MFVRRAVDRDVSADAAEQIATAENVFGIATRQCPDASNDLESAGEVIRNVEAPVRLRKKRVPVVIGFVIPAPYQSARPVAGRMRDGRRRALNVPRLFALGLMQMAGRQLRAPIRIGVPRPADRPRVDLS